MKTVYYSRHAKSSWEHLYLKDIDRPLNRRGKSDAPMMAKRLKVLVEDGTVDGILSSTSHRTRQTLAPFAKVFDITSDRVLFDSNLYLANSDYLVDALFQLSDDLESILLFAHNPGMTDLANEVASNHIENVPTCGIFKVSFECESWTEVDLQNSKMGFFVYPKMYKES